LLPLARTGGRNQDRHHCVAIATGGENNANLRLRYADCDERNLDETFRSPPFPGCPNWAIPILDSYSECSLGRLYCRIFRWCRRTAGVDCCLWRSDGDGCRVDQEWGLIIPESHSPGQCRRLQLPGRGQRSGMSHSRGQIVAQ
jgi:hypothetical protein